MSMNTPESQPAEIMARALSTKALEENSAAEFIEELANRNPATVDQRDTSQIREQADLELTADEIADLRRRGYIAVKLPPLGTDEFGDRVIEVPLGDQPHYKAKIRLDQGETATKLAITGLPSTLNIEHAPPVAAALLAAYAATTGHGPSQASVRFGPIGWNAGSYGGPGIITHTEPTGEFDHATIDELNDHPGEPLWVDRTGPHPHLHIDAQNGTWIYKLTLENETRDGFIYPVYAAELVARQVATIQGGQ